MYWYLKKAFASKPPAYLFERISDLNHAAELCLSSPLECVKILEIIYKEFQAQNNPEEANALKIAIKTIKDSPPKAKECIIKLIDFLKYQKEEYDDEQKVKAKRMKWQKIP